MKMHIKPNSSDYHYVIMYTNLEDYLIHKKLLQVLYQRAKLLIQKSDSIVWVSGIFYRDFLYAFEKNFPKRLTIS